MQLEELKNRCRILNERFDVMNLWLKKRNRGKTISAYLKEQEVNSIAVYGLGTFGERLLEELENSSIKVTCIVDGRLELQGGRYDGIPVVYAALIANYGNIDRVIVTSFHDLENIKKNISAYVLPEKIIGIDEIIKTF